MKAIMWKRIIFKFEKTEKKEFSKDKRAKHSVDRRFVPVDLSTYRTEKSSY